MNFLIDNWLWVVGAATGYMARRLHVWYIHNQLSIRKFITRSYHMVKRELKLPLTVTRSEMNRASANQPSSTRPAIIYVVMDTRLSAVPWDARLPKPNMFSNKSWDFYQ